jgi:protein-disulfide isomerase
MSNFSRRAALVGMMSGLGGVLGRAQAQSPQAFPLETPEGDPIANFAIPPALNPASLPSVTVVGAAVDAPILYEFFDYACPYCRVAFQELDVLLGPDAGFRLGLIHHPVLGANSYKVASLVLAARARYGEAASSKLHHLLLDNPGRITVEGALRVARSMSMDVDQLQTRASSAEIRAVIEAHVQRSQALGLRSTPSFVFGKYAFKGWPGSETIQAIVQSYKQCQGLVCTRQLKT